MSCPYGSPGRLGRELQRVSARKRVSVIARSSLAASACLLSSVIAVGACQLLAVIIAGFNRMSRLDVSSLVAGLDTRAGYRFGSPAADLNKTRLAKITFSAKWPPRPRAEGGQVEPLSGGVTILELHILLATPHKPKCRSYCHPNSSCFLEYVLLLPFHNDLLRRSFSRWYHHT